MAQHNVLCGSSIADTSRYAGKILKYGYRYEMDHFLAKEDAFIEVACGLKT